MGGCGDFASGGCTARVVEPLSRDTLTSAGTFVADASLAFPLTLSVASIEVELGTGRRPSVGSPSLFFTLYSATGATAGGAGESTASGLRGLIWLPIWLSLYSFLRHPLRLDESHGMCTVLFVSTIVCAAGFQIQLWLSGSW